MRSIEWEEERADTVAPLPPRDSTRRVAESPAGGSRAGWAGGLQPPPLSQQNLGNGISSGANASSASPNVSASFGSSPSSGTIPYNSRANRAGSAASDRNRRMSLSDWHLSKQATHNLRAAHQAAAAAAAVTVDASASSFVVPRSRASAGQLVPPQEAHLRSAVATMLQQHQHQHPVGMNRPPPGRLSLSIARPNANAFASSLYGGGSASSSFNTHSAAAAAAAAAAVSATAATAATAGGRVPLPSFLPQSSGAAGCALPAVPDTCDSSTFFSSSAALHTEFQAGGEGNGVGGGGGKLSSLLDSFSGSVHDTTPMRMTADQHMLLASADICFEGGGGNDSVSGEGADGEYGSTPSQQQLAREVAESQLLKSILRDRLVAALLLAREVYELVSKASLYARSGALTAPAAAGSPGAAARLSLLLLCVTNALAVGAVVTWFRASEWAVRHRDGLWMTTLLGSWVAHCVSAVLVRGQSLGSDVHSLLLIFGMELGAMDISARPLLALSPLFLAILHVLQAHHGLGSGSMAATGTSAAPAALTQQQAPASGGGGNSMAAAAAPVPLLMAGELLAEGPVLFAVFHVGYAAAVLMSSLSVRYLNRCLDRLAGSTRISVATRSRLYRFLKTGGHTLLTLSGILIYLVVKSMRAAACSSGGSRCTSSSGPLSEPHHMVRILMSPSSAAATSSTASKQLWSMMRSGLLLLSAGTHGPVASVLRELELPGGSLASILLLGISFRFCWGIQNLLVRAFLQRSRQNRRAGLSSQVCRAMDALLQSTAEAPPAAAAAEASEAVSANGTPAISSPKPASVGVAGHRSSNDLRHGNDDDDSGLLNATAAGAGGNSDDDDDDDDSLLTSRCGGLDLLSVVEHLRRSAGGWFDGFSASLFAFTAQEDESRGVLGTQMTLIRSAGMALLENDGCQVGANNDQRNHPIAKSNPRVCAVAAACYNS